MLVSYEDKEKALTSRVELWFEADPDRPMEVDHRAKGQGEYEWLVSLFAGGMVMTAKRAGVDVSEMVNDVVAEIRAMQRSVDWLPFVGGNEYGGK